MCQGCFIDQKRKLGDRRRSYTVSTGAGGSPPAVCRSVAHLVGGPCACVVGDLALARVRCVSAAWAWGWLLVCVLGDLALGRVRCVWAALGCFAVLRFGFDTCPPSRAFSLLRTPNPQLLHHEVHSATSAFCTLLLLFATSCAMNFVLPPPPVSPRFFHSAASAV